MADEELSPELEHVVQMLVDDIRERNPDAINFEVTPIDLVNIRLYIQLQKYDMLMYMYGHLFLLEVLNTFEAYEKYECCHEIVQQIRVHNARTNDRIPTKNSNLDKQ